MTPKIRLKLTFFKVNDATLDIARKFCCEWLVVLRYRWSFVIRITGTGETVTFQRTCLSVGFQVKRVSQILQEVLSGESHDFNFLGNHLFVICVGQALDASRIGEFATNE